MGNFLGTMRPRDSATLQTPIIRTPLTDFTSHMLHHDGDEECLPFELRFIDCAEAYGSIMAKEKCKLYFQDFLECARQWKQTARLYDMNERRWQLWFQGIRGVGPKFPLYGETPRYDGFVPDYQYDDSHI